MKILFAAQELAGYSTAPAKQVRVNGSILFDESSVIDAPSTSFLPRSNERNQIEFTVRREFASVELSEYFLLMHFHSQTKQGTLEIRCGLSDSDYTSVYYPNAVLVAVPSEFGGLSCTVSYRIMAGAPQLTAP